MSSSATELRPGGCCQLPQAGACRVRGRWQYREAPECHAPWKLVVLMRSPSKKFIWAGRPVAEPEVISTPDGWLVCAKPQDTPRQASGATCSRRKWTLVLAQRAAHRDQGLSSLVMRAAPGSIGAGVKGRICHSKIRKPSILALLAQAVLCFSPRGQRVSAEGGEWRG